MANKKITDVDIVSNVSDDDYLFINQGAAIKQIKKSDIPKPIYTAEEVGALPNTTIIPTTLPNPNALTFTGAATGSYDGSSPVEINIPEGGASDEKIAEVVGTYMEAHPIEESDPTVPQWAKQPEKPTYTASEVGADASGTAVAKVSEHNTASNAHNDIRLLVQGLTERLNALADSDDTTLDQMSEVVAYIKSNKSLIDAITTSKVNVSDIIDNLTTNASNKPLSAAQGVKLKALIDAIVMPTKLSELENDSGYAKTTDIPEKLPNPQKLTFAGAVTAEYDGLGAVTVTIPESSGGTIDDSRIQTAVNNYLDANPVQAGATTEQAEQIRKNTEDISQLSEEKVENPLTGVVGQILEIETVDESGKPKTYKAVNKPSGGGEVTDEQISNAVDNYMTAHPFNETDPTVPQWAKQPEKPTYTASEVGALPVGTKIPSKTSDLQNDSGFLTYHQDLSDYALKSEVPKSASDVGADASGTAESKVSEHNISDTAHNDIRLLVQGLTERLNALADSDDTTLDQMSEVVAYIKNNKNLIDDITTSKVNVSDIINNLTTNLSNKVLSASMGVELKKLIDAIKVPVNLSELAGDTTHRTVTDAEKTAWNNKSTFSGNYNDLTNKPSLFSGNYNDLSGKPTLITEKRVNELINAKLPKSAEEVQY